MNTSGEQETKTINLVKTELDETLHKARQALQDYFDQNDESQLRSVAEHLHQAVGTLQMVEVYGAAMLAEEMEHVVTELVDGQIKHKDDAFDILMRSILQLPAYLDHLQQGHKDLPLTLLPLLNDLRASRGQRLLSENAFFSPDLTILPPISKQDNSNAQSLKSIQQYARKLRPLYQVGLVGIFRSIELKNNIKRLAMILRQLENVAGANEIRQLWWICSGVIEALFEEGLDANISVKLLLGQIDRLIKVLIDGGETKLLQGINDELLKNLLFYVAQAKSRGKRVCELREAFGLGALLPAEGAADQNQSGLFGLNADVVKNVSLAIKEDILSIKDDLDIFVRSGGRSVQQLQPLVEKLRTVADTLGVLGLGKMRKLINEQKEIVSRIIINDSQLEDSVVMGIASALLFVESSINNLRLDSEGHDDDLPTDSTAGNLLPEAEYRQLVNLAVTEANSVLARIKNAVATFAANPGDKEILQETPRLIGEIKGAFVIMSFGRAADLVNSCSKYITQRLIESAAIPDRQDMEALADVLTGIEYFLENVNQDSTNARKSLDVAQSGLIKLGYPPEQLQPELSERQADASGEVTPAPVTETQKQTSEQEESVLDDEIIEIFLEEAEEVLATIREQCKIWNANIDGRDALTTLRRSYHTLKGSGRIVGATKIGDFAWAIENMLNRVIDNSMQASPVMAELLERSQTALMELIDQLKTKQQPSTDIDFIIDCAHKLSQGEPVTFGPPQATSTAAEPGSEAQLDLAIEPDSAIDPVLVEIYTNETREHLSALQDFIGQCKQQQPGCKINDDLLRILHTLHGSSNMAGVDNVAELMDHLDKYIRLLLENDADVREDTLALLDDSAQAIEQLLAGLAHTNPVLPGKEQLLERINALQQLLPDKTADMAAQPLESTLITDIPLADIDDELLKVFLNEAGQIIAQIQDQLKRLHNAPDDLVVVDELRRAVHTLHGGAKIANLGQFAELSNHLETLLSKACEHKITASDQLFSVIESARDWFSESLQALHNRLPMASAAELQTRIDDFTFTPEEALPTKADEAELEKVQEPDLGTKSVEDQAVPEGDDATEEFDTQAPDEAELVDSWIGIGPMLKQAAEQQPATLFDEDLLSIFYEEATDILYRLDKLVIQWKEEPDNTQTVETLQRELHTLKGGARMADVAPIGDVSHVMESVFESITAGKIPISENLVELIQSANDWIVSALEQIRTNTIIEPAYDLIESMETAAGLTPSFSREDKAAALAKMREEEEDTSLAQILAATSTVDAKPLQPQLRKQKVKQIGELVRVSAVLLDNLANNAGEVSIYRSRLEQQFHSIGSNLAEYDQTISRLRDQLRKFEIEAEAQILFRYESTASDVDEHFDPLELDRFSNMQQLSRSLMESVGDLTSIQKLLENFTRESEILLLQQSRVNTELQEGLVSTRLVPFSNIVPRLRSIVRQTCKELDKKAELRVKGAEDEMDRSMLDRLIPAFEHLLRNAIDHGIESAQERENANKSATGQILISFSREGPEVVITIQDDGAGIDLDAIRSKAIERGHMDRNAELSDNEIMQFVLESGLSTANNVTQISGRGVGMDVVNSEIKQLNGSLQIESRKDEGTIFSIRLPFTVSVNQALMVLAGEETYAIPLSAIVGIIRIGYEQLKKLHQDQNSRYKYGGHNYQVFHLGAMLGMSELLLPDPGSKVPLIMACVGDHYIALQVEAIAGRQEIVIKSVGPQISSVCGIAGATILGDGSVALILDIASLVRAGVAHAATRPKVILAPAKAAKTEEEVLVMIVDDSITVRKVTERLISRHHMRTITAKDGVDALTILQEHKPDIMLLDIEMPRMDGYELATAMRSDEQLKHIPIIMITSRIGAKHRERAMSIGIDVYMGKPYEESELVENIQSLLNERE